MGQINNQNEIFNSPLEIGLRLLFIISESTRPLDLQRLVHYNYLLLHSSDVSDGPSSIHPTLPLRACGILINSNVVKQSLNLLVMKDLVSVVYSKDKGIEYQKNAKTLEFIEYFQSDYSRLLKERAKWLSVRFDKLTSGQVADLINVNIGKWGSEFSPVQINEGVYQDV